MTHAAIVGRTGQGKTALSYKLLEEAKKTLPVYVFKHPTPEILEAQGFTPIYDFSDFTELQDCIIWWDEPQLTIKRSDNKAKEALENLMSIARHSGISLIFSTSDTRFFTKGMESYIHEWYVLDVDPMLTKHGGMPAKIIKMNEQIAGTFRLPKGKFLYYSRENYKKNGVHSFQPPKWFNDEWSRPYRRREQWKAQQK